MAFAIARSTLGRVFVQRCCGLFLALLALAVAAPLIEPTQHGLIALNVVNMFIVVAAVAAVGRTAMSFIVALLLAVPTLAFQGLALFGVLPEAMVWSRAFGAALYAATLVYLLQYVFHRDVMTADKLWGAAAAYLLLGALWAYLYALVDHAWPRSFSIGGAPGNMGISELIYFSFTVLTSTGFGDIVPVSRQARSLCIVEQLTGTLFLAILIARLAGVYPPRPRSDA
jgi:Ion channel